METGEVRYQAFPYARYSVARAPPLILSETKAWSYEAAPAGYHLQSPPVSDLGVSAATDARVYPIMNSWQPEFTGRPAGAGGFVSGGLVPLGPQYGFSQPLASEGPNQEPVPHQRWFPEDATGEASGSSGLVSQYGITQHLTSGERSQEHAHLQRWLRDGTTGEASVSTRSVPVPQHGISQYLASEEPGQKPAHNEWMHPHDITNEALGASSLETMTLIEFVDRVVSGTCNEDWEEEAVRRAALEEDSSKHWQRLIETSNREGITNTVRALKGVVFDVMQGEFGHHIFRKLVPVCLEDHLGILVSAMTVRREELLATAKHKHGTKCLRQLLLQVREWKPLVLELTGALATGVASLMMDQFGLELIHTFLSRFDAEETAFIQEGTLNNLKEVARSKYGCLALNEFIDHAPPATKDQLVAEVISRSVSLSQDHYGNFVVQHVVDLQDEADTDRLCRKLRQHWQVLSKHKHGSHVMEKCIASSGGRPLLEELVFCRKPELLSRDPYGNFVVQRALDILKESMPEWYNRLVNALQAQRRLLKYHPIGKHVLRKIDEHQPS